MDIINSEEFSEEELEVIWNEVQNETDTFTLLVEGAGKSLHKKLGISFTYDGQTYNNGKNITFNLRHPCITNNDDAYALLHHELAHIVFKTDVRNWKLLFDEFPHVNKSHLAAIMNILEDVRIEHAWGKLFPGNYASFVRMRKRVLNGVPDEPISMLLAVRAGRQDLIDESHIWLQILAKKYQQSLKQVRGSTSVSCLVSAREIVHLINEYWKKVPNVSKKCKCSNCGVDVTLKAKKLPNVPKVTFTISNDLVYCDDCKQPGGEGGDKDDGDGGGSWKKDSNPKGGKKKKEGEKSAKGDGEPNPLGTGRGLATGEPTKKTSTPPLQTPSPEEWKDLEEEESNWEKFNSKMDKILPELDSTGCLGAQQIKHDEFNEWDTNREQCKSMNNKDLSEQLAKDLGKVTHDDERRNYDRRMRQLKQNIQKKFSLLLAEKNPDALNKLEENIRAEHGEHQTTIPEHEWSFGEWVEPRRAWMKKVKSMMGDAQYNRRYKYNKSGSKIRVSKVINYLASGQNQSLRNFFKKKKMTGKKLSICYVVDMSSSMWGEDERIAKELMLTTDYALKPLNAVTSDYVVFEAGVRARIQNTRLLHQIQAQGGTFASPAIMYGANILNHEHEGLEKVLIFLSDGGHEDVSQALSYCSERNITPMIVCVGGGGYGYDGYEPIYANDYTTAFDIIMGEILGRIKKILEQK